MRCLCKFQIVVVLLCLLGTVAQDVRAVERIYVATDIYTPSDKRGSGEVDIKRANECYQQARKSCVAGDVGAALRWATKAVVVNPDHVGARRVLGYRRVGKHWAGSFAARRLSRGEIWHTEFGWIKAEDLPRYEAGKRPLGKRWVSSADDIRRHAKIAAGWQIRTDHFRVVTNHSPQAATQLASRLEAHYQVWQQLFGGFVLKPKELLKRFDGKETSGYRSKPFHVTYYRTRDEYNRTLVRQQPRIAMTLGIYFDTTRKTHFFAGDEQDAGTIYHETVHQFFYESGRAARNVGARCNIWLVEAVACYFESLVEHQDEQGNRYFTIGQPGEGRLPAARHRRLVNDYYVPLAELSALGINDFQKRTDLPRLYSQSAGLATFLMRYHDGVYRSALVETLQLLYAGKDQPSTLEAVTGRSFAALDREYLEFIRGLSGSPSAEAASP